MTSSEQRPDEYLENERLRLEELRIRLDYRKFVLGSVFVALAIATIPPSFQLATAWLENVKADAELRSKQQVFRDEYIKDFLSNALNQDIELRIRFAQYFAHVSTARQDWSRYLDDLKRSRMEIRKLIDEQELQWRQLIAAKERDEGAISRLERNLAWAYKEVGYLEPNRSAAANPRAPESTRQRAVSASLGRFGDAVHYLTQPLTWSQESSLGRRVVEVPKGFVVTFKIIPNVTLNADFLGGPEASAIIVHEYLYWTQATSRAEADVLLQAMLKDAGIMGWYVRSAVEARGKAVWDEFASQKQAGERRVLREFPHNQEIGWQDWKKRPDVFRD